MAEERTVTRLMIFNVVEDQRRRIRRMLAIEDVDDGAHFEIPIDAFERRELATLVDFTEPVAQALVVHDGSLGKPQRSQSRGSVETHRYVVMISSHQVG